MNITELKKVDTFEISRFIDNEILMYCDEKKSEITIETMRFIQNELAKVAVAFAAKLVKENNFTGTYDEFSSQICVNDNVKEIFDNTVKEIWWIVEKVSSKYDNDELLSYILWGETNLHSVHKDESTSDSIIELAYKVLDIKEGESVLNLCSGKGKFIRDCYLNNANVKYQGVEIDYEKKGISELRMSALGVDGKIYLSDVFDFEGSYKYDKVFSHYPLNLKHVNVENKLEEYVDLFSIDERTLKSASSDWLYNLSVIENMSESGKGVALSIGKDLWSMRNPDLTIRKNIIEKGFIESVIALPSSILEYTSIPVYLIVFSRDNKYISMVDASNMGTKRLFDSTVLSELEIKTIVEAMKEETEISSLVGIDEIKNNDYTLDPVKHLNVIPEFEDGVCLEDIALSITRGDQTRTSELKEFETSEKTNFRLIELADLKDGYFEFGEKYLDRIPDGKEKYLAKNHSIILKRVGNPKFSSAMIEKEDDEEILVTGHFLMIELDETKVNPGYVQSFLTSDLGKRCLENISTGSQMKNLSLSKLRNLKIPVPTKEIQDEISAEYLSTLDEIQLLKKKLIQKNEMLKHTYEEGYFAKR